MNNKYFVNIFSISFSSSHLLPIPKQLTAASFSVRKSQSSVHLASINTTGINQNGSDQFSRLRNVTRKGTLPVLYRSNGISHSLTNSESNLRYELFLIRCTYFYIMGLCRFFVVPNTHLLPPYLGKKENKELGSRPKVFIN